MFNKLFIFALLGATLVFAFPQGEIETVTDVSEEKELSFSEKLNQYWNELKEKTKHLYEKAMGLLNDLKSKFDKLKNLAQDEYVDVKEHLAAKLEEAKHLGSETYEKFKAQYDETVAELDHKYNELTQLAEEQYEDIKKTYSARLEEAAKLGEETYEKVKLQYEQTLKEEQEKFTEKLNEIIKKAKEIIQE